MNLHARRWYVTGRVQGVGFRYFAQRRALEIGLQGWARNLDDGRVEVRWRAIERNSGEVAGAGVDVFTGDTDGIWTAASTNPLVEGMRFAALGDKPGDKEAS